MRKALLCAMLILICSIGVRAGSLNGDCETLMGFGDDYGQLEEVRIALIDTGITSARLNAERILSGKSYVLDRQDDAVGHGTRIASLIIGASDDGYISDLAPNARLIPLTYYSKYPSGVDINGGVEMIVQGIYDAVDIYNADIIVISSGIAERDSTLEEAVLYAEKMNVAVISAVGNDGNDTPLYPAAFSTVIGVGSVNKNGELSSFSQRSKNVTVTACGEELTAVSIRNHSFFETVSGTSESCAYVAALSALLKGKYPDMTPSELRYILCATSNGGLINARAAMAGEESVGFIRINKRIERAMKHIALFSSFLLYIINHSAFLQGLRGEGRRARPPRFLLNLTFGDRKTRSSIKKSLKLLSNVHNLFSKNPSKCYSCVTIKKKTCFFRLYVLK